MVNLNDASKAHTFAAATDQAYLMKNGPVGKDATTVVKPVASAAADKSMTSFTHVETNPDIPTFMRTNNRWDYFSEYADFWKNEKTNAIKFVFFLGAGIFTLPIFPPGGLLMIAMAARFKSLQFWNKFVYRDFGKTRTLIMID